MSTHVIILAAGKGSRMRSSLPKVLAKLANRPLLSHVINTAQKLSEVHIHVVIGHGADKVKSVFSNIDVNWIIQDEQLGTGHAVKIALPKIPNNANVLILYGDVPLIKRSSLQALIDQINNADLCILSAILDDATGYGRITRDPNQRVSGIVEHKDASKEQLTIDEVNTGILAANSGKLKKWLNQITPNNAQGEYYLTDVVSLAYTEGCQIKSEQANNLSEVTGVNSRIELAALERTFQNEFAQSCMKKGLTLVDPNRFDVRGNFLFGIDCQVDINVILNGNVTIGDNVVIHANCILTNCNIADNSVIHPQSILEDCAVGKRVNIGPFARIRPGTVLDDEVKIGNFVEIKKSQLSQGAKVNHLSYIGDSEIGKNTNIGAGTITCNYDGTNKFKTVIGNNAFIGSNSQIVAPVLIADDVTIAAGSTITSDVPKDSLAVARSKQKNITGWRRPKKST